VSLEGVHGGHVWARPGFRSSLDKGGALQAGGAVSNRRSFGRQPGQRDRPAPPRWVPRCRQSLAVLGGRGQGRGVGDEPVVTREVFEVALRPPDVAAGSGTGLDHRCPQQIGTRKRCEAAVDVHDDPLGAIKGLAGSRELGCGSGGTVVRSARPPMPSRAITSNARPLGRTCSHGHRRPRGRRRQASRLRPRRTSA
jgi:hypothetical protein